MPSFSLSNVSNTDVIPTRYSTDPYTGANITNLGYTVCSLNITIIVQNNPQTTAYELEVKGHYASQWNSPSVDDYNVTAFASNGSQTAITLYGDNNTSGQENQIFLQYGGHWGINVPFGGQLDFRLQSVSGETPIRVLFGYEVLGNVSSWSQVQTVTLPDYSDATTIVSPNPTLTPAPTSTPTIPEFQLTIQVIAILLTSTLLAVAIKRKQSRRMEKHG
jgi:hypothetical protein